MIFNNEWNDIIFQALFEHDQSAHTRELTREYYFSHYGDIGKRTSILRELLGGIGENVAIDTPFHCDHGKNIFGGNDVIINMNCTFVDNKTIQEAALLYLQVSLL